MSKVTIIILTWNCLEYTKKCIESLKQSNAWDEADIIVTDNGSTDETLEYLHTVEGIVVLENKENLGFVKGNNIAIETVKTGDIVLLNNDIIITQKDWLEKLQEHVYSKEEYGIAGCRLVNEKRQLLHAGTFICPETNWGQQIGGGQKDINQFPSIREVQGVVFACAYIKRAVLDKIGGLNTAFFSYFEDTDYCLRAAEVGYKTICCGDVTLIHYQNISTAGNQVDFSEMFLKSQKTFKQLWDEKLNIRLKDYGVSWNSIVSFPSGYAVSCKNMMLALDALDVDVRYQYVYGAGTPFPVEEPETSDHYKIDVIRGREFNKDYPQIVYGQGDVFYKNTGKYKIGFTMLETTGIPKEWVKQANKMDEIWVPSSFNKNTFRDSGVTVPIYIVPLGIDPNYFNPQIRSYKKGNKFIFLSVFEWGERKAPEILLRAYTKAFKKKDDVLLICKVFNNDGSFSVPEEIRKLNLSDDSPDIVILHNQRINDYEMSTLYRSADCFVLPTRGEGWGMPILEAMAVGLPVISTDWSSQTDFMNDRNAYPLRIKQLIDAKAKCPYYEGFQWADPDEDHLVELMRYVYSHQDEAKEKGKIASEEALSLWTWEQAARKIKNRLDSIREQE